MPSTRAIGAGQETEILFAHSRCLFIGILLLGISAFCIQYEEERTAWSHPKRLAAPIRGDEREQPVFNLVPFAGARRKVTNGNRKARFIRELLQLQFPEPQP